MRRWPDRGDDEGYRYLAGRAKDSIVSGGVNIYPAEIEAAMLRRPAVRDVAVVGVSGDEFGERILASVSGRRIGKARNV